MPLLAPGAPTRLTRSRGERTIRKITSLSGGAGGRIALQNRRDLYPFPMADLGAGRRGRGGGGGKVYSEIYAGAMIANKVGQARSGTNTMSPNAWRRRMRRR